jgi:hypothetical protein
MSMAAPANSQSKGSPTQPPAAPPSAPKSGYDVSRPQGICHVSGKPIEPDEKFMAALRETPQGFERVDVSLPHWAEFDHKDVLAFWQTQMPRHEQKKKVFVDDTVLCELFDRLGSATEPAKLNFRFVLGLILMRKKLLVYETTRHEADGRDIWCVRPKGRDEKLDLVDPKLDEQQMMEVSKQLGEILNEEL